MISQVITWLWLILLIYDVISPRIFEEERIVILTQEKKEGFDYAV